MTRDEALRILGLEEGASADEIKLAYKELAQILHPDKYADNKRLADRATEQFKHVNEARELLLGSKSSARRGGAGGAGGAGGSSRGQAGGRSGHGGPGSAGSAGGAGGSNAAYDAATTLKARLAGIAAARVQLTAQLDAESDRRRVGAYLLIGGIVGMILGEFFKMRMIEPLGGAALIWGIIQIFNSQGNIKVIKGHLESLDKERKKCEKKLGKL